MITWRTTNSAAHPVTADGPGPRACSASIRHCPAGRSGRWRCCPRRRGARRGSGCRCSTGRNASAFSRSSVDRRGRPVRPGMRQQCEWVLGLLGHLVDAADPLRGRPRRRARSRPADSRRRADLAPAAFPHGGHGLAACSPGWWSRATPWAGTRSTMRSRSDRCALRSSMRSGTRCRAGSSRRPRWPPTAASAAAAGSLFVRRPRSMTRSPRPSASRAVHHRGAGRAGPGVGAAALPRRGHPYPLLMREGRVVKSLTGGRTTPFGLATATWRWPRRSWNRGTG